MNTYTLAQVNEIIRNKAKNALDNHYDNQGQVVIYTGVFEWKDGTFHDEPDPEFDEED